jgi:hypothetical protein
MPLSRKHFKEIAVILGSVKVPNERRRLSQDFARFCEKHNDNFDATRFLGAVEDTAATHGFPPFAEWAAATREGEKRSVQVCPGLRVSEV